MERRPSQPEYKGWADSLVQGKPRKGIKTQSEINLQMLNLYRRPNIWYKALVAKTHENTSLSKGIKQYITNPSWSHFAMLYYYLLCSCRATSVLSAKNYSPNWKTYCVTNSKNMKGGPRMTVAVDVQSHRRDVKTLPSTASTAKRLSPVE